MKNKISIGLGALLLSVSTASSAQLVTASPVETAEIIAGNKESALQHYAMEALEKAKAELMKSLSAENIDAMNNGFSNMIVRTTQTATDMFNLERLADAIPAISACGASSLQVLDRDSLCEQRKEEASSMAKHANRHATEGMSVTDQHKAIDYVQRRYFDSCRDLSGGSEHFSECSNAGNLFGTVSGPTRDPETQEASNHFVEAIVGISPDFKAPPEDINNLSDQEVARYNRQQTKEAYRSLVAVSLEAVNRERTSPNPDQFIPSNLHKIHAFNNDRWGNEEWMRRITNATLTDDEKNSTTETQILRELAVMEAFQVNMNVMNYEREMRKEALLAAQLSIMKESL